MALIPTSNGLNRLVACAQGTPLFQALTLSECTEIVSIAQERRFAKRQTIFQQGDPLRFAFVLLSGRVKITGAGREGADVILTVIEAGHLVAGGLGLVPSHTTTAEALERCHVLMWKTQIFQNLCERYLMFCRNAVRIVDDSLRLLEDRFRKLVTEQVTA